MWVNFKMTQSWSRVSRILWLPGETEDQEAIRDDVSTSFWVYDPWRAKSTLDATPKDYRLQAAQVLGLGRATWSWTLSPGVSWPRQGTNSPGCPPNFGGWTHRLLLPVTRPSVLQEWSPVFGWMTTKAHSGATKPGAVRSPWQDKPRAVLSLTGQVISRALLDLTSHELCSRQDKPRAALSLTGQATSRALTGQARWGRSRTSCSHEPRPWPEHSHDTSFPSGSGNTTDIRKFTLRAQGSPPASQLTAFLEEMGTIWPVIIIWTISSRLLKPQFLTAGCCGCSVTKSCPTPCDPTDGSTPASCPSLSPEVCSDSQIGGNVIQQKAMPVGLMGGSGSWREFWTRVWNQVSGKFNLMSSPSYLEAYCLLEHMALILRT